METNLAKDIDAILDEYEKRVGIPPSQASPEVEKYLNADENSLKLMDIEAVSIGKYLLAQFSKHIQIAYNRQIARVNWSEANIDIVISKETCQYNDPSYKERRDRAIRGNDAARKLNEIRIKAKAASDSLAFLADKIKYMSETLTDIIHAKRRKFDG